ncbi:MAG TPA: DUF4342 domain-containing protein, partial [Candidatus Limnocylindria bacterium]|nr:DUF4342 domain-containing protein [Candidatus Limnocylindria bacterium]
MPAALVADGRIGIEEDDMGTETGTPRTEEFKINGDELIAKVKELVHEGNIRRVIIRNEEGTTLVEIPLSVGLVGVALLPIWAAVGAIAALATDCTIVVERR